MAVNKEQYLAIKEQLAVKGTTLVAVSKTKAPSDILALYELGHRDFGENYVQELVDKQAQLPSDINWHFIGHLQTNKVKYLASFVHLVHGVDSFKLLREINKQGEKLQRKISVLLQIHIATEETKFGLDETELVEILDSIEKDPLPFVQIKGMMGMASFTDNMEAVREEFKSLNQIFHAHKVRHSENVSFDILSMGMSADFTIAIEEGSSMVRIGSLLFGNR